MKYRFIGTIYGEDLYVKGGINDALLHKIGRDLQSLNVYKPRNNWVYRTLIRLKIF